MLALKSGKYVVINDFSLYDEFQKIKNENEDILLIALDFEQAQCSYNCDHKTIDNTMGKKWSFVKGQEIKISEDIDLDSGELSYKIRKYLSCCHIHRTVISIPQIVSSTLAPMINSNIKQI